MGARIELQRRLEWIDTDAAVRWHHSVVWRWAEWAEAELHRRLGIVDVTVGATPRRRVEAEFVRAVTFDDLVDVTFEVEAVGRTSVTYAMALSSQGEPVASARLVAVFTDGEGRSAPWPEEVAAALRDGTPVR